MTPDAKVTALTCSVCGRRFAPRTPNQRTARHPVCSPECRKKSNRRRARDARKPGPLTAAKMEAAVREGRRLAHDPHRLTQRLMADATRDGVTLVDFAQLVALARSERYFPCWRQVDWQAVWQAADLRWRNGGSEKVRRLARTGECFE